MRTDYALQPISAVVLMWNSSINQLDHPIIKHGERPDQQKSDMGMSAMRA